MRSPLQQPSFIPKESVPKARAFHKAPVVSSHILRNSSIILLLLASIATLSVFLYERVMLANASSKKAELEEMQHNLDVNILKDFVLLDRRLRVVNELLSTHVAPSRFFEYLEGHTARDIKFNSLSFAPREGGGGGYHAVLTGEAASFAAVAFQSDVLTESSEVQNVVVSNFVRSDTGMVQFDLEMSIRPDLLEFLSPLTQ